MKYVLAILTALVLAPAAQCQDQSADDDQWFNTFEDEESVFAAKRGSLEITHEPGEKKSAHAIFRLEVKENGRISFYKFKVSASDCNKGYGTLAATNFDGSFVANYGFVKAGGNYASKIAESLCIAMQTRDAAEHAATDSDVEAKGDP